MDVKNHNMNKEKPIMRKRLKVIAFLAFFLGIVLAVSQYFGFVSKTVYGESVSHLTEVFHQSDNMLRELTENRILKSLHPPALSLYNHEFRLHWRYSADSHPTYEDTSGSYLSVL